MKAEKSVSNRDALLAGAKKCLLEKGYNRTTARDIASAAGVSLAAIGYHFASKDALLTEALLLAFGEWDEDLQCALRIAAPPGMGPEKRFETIWARIMATFETHRPLWVANFEIFTQMVGQERSRRLIADKVHMARAGLAAMFLHQDEKTLSERTVRTTGTLLHVLLSGLVLQWLIDPGSALSARDLTEALRETAESLGPRKKSGARKRTARGTPRSG